MYFCAVPVYAESMNLSTRTSTLIMRGLSATEAYAQAVREAKRESFREQAERMLIRERA